MVEQNNTLKQQRFENTFFQMLNLFNSIVNSMDLRNKQSKEVIHSGRDCFQPFYNRLRLQLDSIIDNKQLNYSTASEEDLIEAFEIFYIQNKADLSHYFRTLYHTIKFIHTSSIENKKQYISIVRSQLSSYEQILIFYNCLHQNGKTEFKPLVEEYSLLKNIDYSLLFDEDTHIKFYSTNAFGH